MMTLRNNNKFLAVLLFSCTLLIAACKKNDYYKDSGIHSPNYPGNMLEYLSHDTLHFDTLVSVIKLAGMESVFQNDEVTFFAPSDPSIDKSIRYLNRYLKSSGKDTVEKLNDIKPEVWKQTLSMYLFNGIRRFKDYPQVDTLALDTYGGQGYFSKAKIPMNIGVVYNDVKNDDIVIKYSGSRQLMISYLSNLSKPKSDWYNAMVASSDIMPTNGVVHSLQFSRHSFGFNTDQFVTIAIENGIGE